MHALTYSASGVGLLFLGVSQLGSSQTRIHPCVICISTDSLPLIFELVFLVVL